MSFDECLQLYHLGTGVETTAGISILFLRAYIALQCEGRKGVKLLGSYMAEMPEKGYQENLTSLLAPNKQGRGGRALTGDEVNELWLKDVQQRLKVEVDAEDILWLLPVQDSLKGGEHECYLLVKIRF